MQWQKINLLPIESFKINIESIVGVISYKFRMHRRIPHDFLRYASNIHLKSKHQFSFETLGIFKKNLRMFRPIDYFQ